MSKLTRKIRSRGPLFLARELIGTLALHGWRPTRDRIRRFVANAKSVDNAGLSARQAYEIGRTAQYEFCQRYAKDPPRGRERMLQHLLERHSGFRGIVLYPTSHVPEQRERAEHLLRAWAEAGYLCVILPVDSAVPSIERLGERLYLARLHPDAIAYFRDRPVILLVSETIFAYVSRLLQRAFVVYDVAAVQLLRARLGPRAVEDHAALLDRADILLFKSEAARDREQDRGAKAMIVANGVFPEDYAQMPIPRVAAAYFIGYHGGISELLDFELLHDAAALPGVRVLIAGPVNVIHPEAEAPLRTKLDRLLANPNVEYLGPLTPEQLKEFLARIHCGVLPLLASGDTGTGPPLELFELIAAGRPVLATETSGLEAYADVILVAGREEMLRRLRERQVSFDPERYAQVARRHAWNALAAPATAILNVWSDQRPLPAVAYPASRRVDIINFNFFDWDGEKVFNGGAERYVHDIAVLCRKLGLEPRLLQNARRPFERDFHGVPVVGLKLTDRFDLASMSEAYEPHLSEAGLVIASPLDLAARLGAGRRIVGINHGIHWDQASNTLAQYSFERHRTIFDALQVTDACVCVDTNFINWVRCHDWQLAQALEYVPNYVDLATFKPMPKDFEAEHIVVLYPRRLYRARGFEDTLQACESLFRRGLPIELRLCGGADSREAALARAFVARHARRASWDELGIHEMHRAYESSHIVLVPTNYSEGTSLSCIEGMATRNGIVATNVGGLPNLILDGYNGLLIKPGAHDLALAIGQLVEDRALLTRLADNAVQVAQSLSRERWERRWTGIIHRLLPRLVPEPLREAVTSTD